MTKANAAAKPYRGVGERGSEQGRHEDVTRGEVVAALMKNGTRMLLKVRNTPSRMAGSRIGLSSGTVMLQKDWRLEAPSRSAAS